MTSWTGWDLWEDLRVVRHAALREVARERANVMVDRLRELVSCESPSGDVAALAHCADVLTG